MSPVRGARRPADVDEYIMGVPKEFKVRLEKLRAIIKETVPEAEERISYGIPYYDYKGRLAYFRLATRHLAIFIPTPILKQHKRELKNYDTSDATLRLPLDEELPVALIRKLVKARAMFNDENEKKR